MLQLPVSITPLSEARSGGTIARPQLPLDSVVSGGDRDVALPAVPPALLLHVAASVYSPHAVFALSTIDMSLPGKPVSFSHARQPTMHSLHILVMSFELITRTVYA